MARCAGRSSFARPPPRAAPPRARSARFHRLADLAHADERPADPARRTALGRRLRPGPGAVGRSAVANQRSREQGLRGHRNRHGGGSSRRLCRALGIRRRALQSDRQPGRDRHEDGSEALAGPAPPVACSWTSASVCAHGEAQAVTVIPGAAFSGSMDGHLRAYSTIDGKILWDYDTAKDFVDGQPSQGGRRLAGPGRSDHRQRSRLRQFGQRTGTPGQCAARLFRRRQIGPLMPVFKRTVSASLSLCLALYASAAFAANARSRRAAAGDRRLGGQGVRHDALSGPVQALDQAGPTRCERLRRRHRRQAHIDQRARGALRNAGAGSSQCVGRQGAGQRGRRGSRHRPRRAAAR